MATDSIRALTLQPTHPSLDETNAILEGIVTATLCVLFQQFVESTLLTFGKILARLRACEAPVHPYTALSGTYTAGPVGPITNF